MSKSAAAAAAASNVRLRVHNIQSAFSSTNLLLHRRERALTTLAEIKASIIALYWQHRDWPQVGLTHQACYKQVTLLWYVMPALMLMISSRGKCAQSALVHAAAFISQFAI